MLPNEPIAQRLDEVARLLNEQGASLYRVEAWRRAAMNVRRLPAPVSQIYEREGTDGLRKLPGVGDRIGIALRDVIVTGKLPMLDRLRGEMDPVEILRSVPGIGRVQAARLPTIWALTTWRIWRQPRMTGGWPMSRDSEKSALPASSIRWPAASVASGSQPQSRRMRFPLRNSSISIVSTGKRQRQGNCAGSLPADSIRKARLGFRSYTLSAAIATTQRCSRTLLARTTWEGRATGSSSIGTASLANASARS